MIVVFDLESKIWVENTKNKLIKQVPTFLKKIAWKQEIRVRFYCLEES